MRHRPLRLLALGVLCAALAPVADRPFRAGQVYDALHRRGVADFAAMTDLSRPLREALAERFRIDRPEPVESSAAPDGTVKHVLRLADGATVEAVDILDAAIPTTDPAEIYSVTHKALASSLKVIARADDSSGIIGDACRRLLELHPRAAAAARTPVGKLIDWMMKFQFDDEVDFFELDPVAYGPALGETGMKAYRKRLAEVEAKLGPRPAERWNSGHSHEWFTLDWNAQRLAVLEDYELAVWDVTNPQSGPERYQAQAIGTPFTADLAWIGNERIMACERGASFGYNNLVSDMRSLSVMRDTGCPVVFDATHSVQLPGGAGGKSGGQREFVPVLTRAAVAVGISGIFMETHPDPDKALSDGPNAWPLGKMEALLSTLLELDRITKRVGFLESTA